MQNTDRTVLRGTHSKCFGRFREARQKRKPALLAGLPASKIPDGNLAAKD